MSAAPDHAIARMRQTADRIAEAERDFEGAIRTLVILGGFTAARLASRRIEAKVAKTMQARGELGEGWIV